MKVKVNRQLGCWLYTGAFFIFIQIVLGGITRLTGSGLSITEWQPLLGALPPMNPAAWQHSFAQYQQIAQFKVVNSHFSLADYQAIFFWEWLHRNWARTIGLVFIIPFTVFSFQKKISAKLFLRLLLLFTLGVLQALIGWIMVKSGLNGTSLAVNEVKLAVHFLAALLLLCYTLSLAADLYDPYELSYATHPSKKDYTAAITFALILLQMFYGALMAGAKAALAAPTWPDMNGFIFPPELYTTGSDPLRSHLLWIQLIHRTLALLVAIMAGVLYSRSSFLARHSRLSAVRSLPLLFTGIQITLGVLTLLNSFSPHYKIYALLHQATGLLLMMSVLLVLKKTHQR